MKYVCFLLTVCCDVISDLLVRYNFVLFYQSHMNGTNFSVTLTGLLYKLQSGFGPDKYIPEKELSAIMKLLPTIQVDMYTSICILYTCSVLMTEVLFTHFPCLIHFPC